MVTVATFWHWYEKCFSMAATGMDKKHATRKQFIFVIPLTLSPFRGSWQLNLKEERPA